MQRLELADYRAAVARIYLTATDLSDFRARRDELFAYHPQSPIPSTGDFEGLSYFPPDERFRAEVELRAAPGEIEIDTGGPDGVCRYDRVGILDTPWGALSLWWLGAYGYMSFETYLYMYSPLLSLCDVCPPFDDFSDWYLAIFGCPPA